MRNKMKVEILCELEFKILINSNFSLTSLNINSKRGLIIF